MSKARQNSYLICITSREMHIPNSKSISEKTDGQTNGEQIKSTVPSEAVWGIITSRYLDDIFTIDDHEFENFSGICSNELRLNKANTSDKETSLLDLNIKHIDSERSCQRLRPTR